MADLEDGYYWVQVNDNPPEVAQHARHFDGGSFWIRPGSDVRWRSERWRVKVLSERLEAPK